VLSLFASLPTLGIDHLGGRAFQVTVKAVIGVLIVVFGWLEASRRLEQLTLPPRYLVLGGLLSGFFGGVVSTVIVDTVRLVVYGLSLFTQRFVEVPGELAGVVVAAIGAAFLGAYVGARVLEQVTLRVVRVAVATMSMVVGAGLLTGLV
jgi:hypothetical protein